MKKRLPTQRTIKKKSIGIKNKFTKKIIKFVIKEKSKNKIHNMKMNKIIFFRLIEETGVDVP